MGANENVGIILGSVYCETFYEKKGITMNKMLSSLYRTALQAGAGIMTGGIILSFVAGGHVSGFLVKLVAVMALVGAILYSLPASRLGEEWTPKSLATISTWAFALASLLALIFHLAMPFQKFLVDLLAYVAAFAGLISAISVISNLQASRWGASRGTLLGAYCLTTILAVGALTTLIPGEVLLPMKGQAVFAIIGSLASWVTIALLVDHYRVAASSPREVISPSPQRGVLNRILLWVGILLLMMGVVGAFIGTYLLAAVLVLLGHLLLSYVLCQGE